ncbi:MAG TPA: YaaL family protein [Firmicutes bacterium]|nr:YaaL family protein [Bacillota bacterium]
MKNPLMGLLGAPSPQAEEMEGIPGKTTEDLLADVEQARQEWLHAKAFFDHVTDPDLIDMAIYSIEAAEKRYMYLLKVARLQGVNLGSATPH